MSHEKTALITAGGSGMGADAARRLSADGFRVGILSSSGKGEALGAELGGREVSIIRAFAKYSVTANEMTEDIGARRLHTVIEKVLEDISFDADEKSGETIIITKQLVEEKLSDIVKDEDTTRYIL